MKAIVYSTRPYDREYLEMANQGMHEFHFYETQLERQTAMLARGFPAICYFLDDKLDASMPKQTLRECHYPFHNLPQRVNYWVSGLLHVLSSNHDR